MTCLYCGEPTPRPMLFHACCYPFCRTLIEHEISSHWNLLEVLADREDRGIADTFSVLDEWERCGIIQRSRLYPKNRMLTERGYKLYNYLREKRIRRYKTAMVE